MTREEAIETVLAMAKVQDGYAKRATDPGLKIIHKANAKAQREVAVVIAADLAALDRVRSDYANIVKDLIAKQTEIVAAEAANAALTARNEALERERDAARNAALGEAIEAMSNKVANWSEDEDLHDWIAPGKTMIAEVAAIHANAGEG